MPKKKHLIGSVGEPMWGWGAYFEAWEVINFVEENRDEEVIEFILISGGGDATEGMNIANYLEASEKTIQITAFEAQSAALNILAAGTPGYRFATPEATLMVHLPWTGSMGNKEEMEDSIELLKKVEEKIVSQLARRTKRDEAFWSELIQSSNQQITPTEALEYGLIDAIKMPEDVNPELVTAARRTNARVMAMANKYNYSQMSLYNSILKKAGLVSALEISVEGGQMLHINAPKDELGIGQSAFFQNGTAATDGEYAVQDSGQIIVIQNGKISELKEKDLIEEGIGEEVEASKIFEALASGQGANKKSISAMKKKVNSFEKRFDQIKEETDKQIKALMDQNAELKAMLEDLRANTSSTHLPQEQVETQEAQANGGSYPSFTKGLAAAKEILNQKALTKK